MRNNNSSQLIWNFVANTVSSSHLIPSGIRVNILKKMGMVIGSGNSIRPGCYFRSPDVRIGSGSWVNNDCFFDNDFGCEIEIGENCGIGMNVLFCSSSHEIGTSRGRAGKDIKQGIKIGNGCWVGSRVTIHPGVEIKEGCVIASGAVVIKDCEPNGLYAGVPAKRKRNLPVEPNCALTENNR